VATHGSQQQHQDELEPSFGSFTVVNPLLVTERSANESMRIPLGNHLFPELTSAIFELEQELTTSLNLSRPPSSHCGVNRNAEFTPHVDSGRGAGQSLSMIVGLGDYNHDVGGQITIEGVSHDVWYRPIEFDGWRKRHWTEPFEGERFSLVWFTPEGDA